MICIHWLCELVGLVLINELGLVVIDLDVNAIQIYERNKRNNRLNTITQRYREQQQISSEQ
jgi:hypothetical protein